MTRDAISVDWTWRNRRLKLVDTAGLRRRARIDDKVEKLATADGLRVVRLAQVVILVVDAAAPLDKQDLTIARLVIDEGRALVLAVNKWDAAEDKDAVIKLIEDRLQTSLNQARGIKVVTISALRETRLDALLDGVLETYDIWNSRVPTSQLNRWLEGVMSHHPPPLVEGRRLKIRFMTQVKGARRPSRCSSTSPAICRKPTSAIWWRICGTLLACSACRCVCCCAAARIRMRQKDDLTGPKDYITFF